MAQISYFLFHLYFFALSFSFNPLSLHSPLALLQVSIIPFSFLFLAFFNVPPLRTFLSQEWQSWHLLTRDSGEGRGEGGRRIPAKGSLTLHGGWASCCSCRNLTLMLLRVLYDPPRENAAEAIAVSTRAVIHLFVFTCVFFFFFMLWWFIYT